MKRLVLLAGIACAMLAVSVAPAPAQAKAPCWKVLLNDWLDGRIDSVYPVACYRAAIDHLPTDIDQYSSAREDILRALQAKIAGKAAPPNKSDRKSGGTLPGGTGGGGNNNSGNGGGPANSGPVGKAIKSVGPSSVDAVPLPLIVLSAIAGLLLALGAAGLIARRMQTRRMQTRRPQIRTAESPAPPRNS
jgi:hypothetical protein